MTSGALLADPLMDSKRVIESLNNLRREWMGHKNDPTFIERMEWVNGVIKGIDLAIWIISTEDNRPK